MPSSKPNKQLNRNTAFKADRSIKRNQQNVGIGNVLLNTSKTGKDGDFRLSRKLNGVKMELKYGDHWYQFPLERKQKERFQYQYYDQVYSDTSVTASTYHHIPIGVNDRDTSLSSLFGQFDTMLVPADTTITEIGFVAKTASHASGAIGFKLYRYETGKSSGAADLISNYDIVDAQESTFAVSEGSYYSFKVAKNRYKKGDLVALTLRGSQSAFFNGLHLMVMMKHFYKDLD